MIFIYNCSPEIAKQIQREVIDQGLAAFASLGPQVEQTYKENNTLVVRENTMLFIYTEKKQEVVDLIQKIHPTKSPQVSSLETGAGNADFMDWTEENLYD